MRVFVDKCHDLYADNPPVAPCPVCQAVERGIEAGFNTAAAEIARLHTEVEELTQVRDECRMVIEKHIPVLRQAVANRDVRVVELESALHRIAQVDHVGKDEAFTTCSDIARRALFGTE